jgi:hypothetical protein
MGDIEKKILVEKLSGGDEIMKVLWSGLFKDEEIYEMAVACLCGIHPIDYKRAKRESDRIWQNWKENGFIEETKCK